MAYHVRYRSNYPTVRARRRASRRADCADWRYNPPVPAFDADPEDCQHDTTFCPGINSTPRDLTRVCYHCGAEVGQG